MLPYFCAPFKRTYLHMAKIPINLKDGSIEQTEIIVGIDLGTTNSLIAFMKDGNPVALGDKDQENTLVPSIINFGKDGTLIVGDLAKEELIREPERTIFSIKRLLGKSYGEISDYQRFFGYKIIDDGTDNLVKVRVDDTFHNPIELSAHILRALKARAETVLAQKISKVVITVPAYFNDAQRQATRDAGKLAGLEVLRIINEPTAASLAYGLQSSQTDVETIAVYDLGGGTFDISILQIENGIFEVLSTNGDTFLGGDDFDKAIFNYWIDQYHLEDNDEANKRQQLRLAAEAAKKALSQQENFEIEFEGITLSLSQTEFESLISPLVDRTIAACQRALADANLVIEDIDHIVMVGGSTRTPLVRKAVKGLFKKELHDKLNPDEVVACGAAIQADILAGNQKDMLLLDITPLSLGIETVGGLMDVILPRNSKIPARVARNYTTSVDGQKNLKVAVFQGERDLVADNRKLGEFILRNIPAMPAGIPKIEISFLIDADGILIVRAKELRSGTEQEVEIKSTYGISEEEMAKMLIDSLENAQADIAEKAIREAINEANHIVQASEKFIDQNRHYFEEAVISSLEDKITELMGAITKRDKNIIEKAMDDLNTFSTPLAHQALDKNIGEAMKGKKI